MAKGDPRKPKGKMSAYAYFVQTCHEEHKKKTPEIPVNFTEFSKKCSGRWKMMTEKEKSKFEDLARQDKVRYDQEMMHYNPGNKRGKKKDPNAPKRPPSGFFIFCSDHRPKIKAQFPGLGIGDVAKKLGEIWNSLPDGSKQPYLQKANKLKDKYQKDVADYRSKGKVGSGGGVGGGVGGGGGMSMSMSMGNGMAVGAMNMGMGMGMSMGMAPKQMMKGHKDDDDDEDDDEDEEDEDDEDEDDDE
ncbi:hypothetical protein AALO_G00296220 [Alosa alosa]|uniref:HMG box domain-containing protein n=1 Tax=Alosa alosa TaxID=278164 RepID=A0AAV6FDA7_9TELE|nr:high mobility group protein B3a [Alosa sapidissima]XP_048092092.1 high mobility group protein B3a [Alosa alosa]KAG5260764.1 hypothetical protein AALO_G00296220 [Alosa alosa]